MQEMAVFLPGAASNALCLQEIATICFAIFSAADATPAATAPLTATLSHSHGISRGADGDTVALARSPVVGQRMSREAIRAAFKKYDLVGDNKVTFLKLKTVFEMQGVSVADNEIRTWIRRLDRHGKDYVTLEDFEAAYSAHGASHVQVSSREPAAFL
jgi:hypothetical protein